MHTKYIPRMTGYKATNADMTCSPDGVQFKFTLGQWAEIEGEPELCKRGFHFCVQPSGPWCFYSREGTRIFKVEAEDVLDVPVKAGADFKLVARRIRLVEEITPGGDQNAGHQNTGHRNTGHWNTGDQNTGHRNTGDRNTGDRNTGHWNTGHQNTGHQNTGHQNTGDRNTGDRNTGHRNTGDRNTGDRNTGHWNTGDQNTGDQNTGHWNTGHWNTGDRNTGFFCVQTPKVLSFDMQTDLTRDEFLSKYPRACDLGELLLMPAPIPFEPYADIPGITPKKLAALHAAHLAGRKITPNA